MENERVSEVPTSSVEPVNLGEILPGLYINVEEDYGESLEFDHENELYRKYRLEAELKIACHGKIPYGKNRQMMKFEF